MLGFEIIDLVKLMISEGPILVAMEATFNGKKIELKKFKSNIIEYNNGKISVNSIDVITDL